MSLKIQYAPGEIVTLGKALYESHIRQQIEDDNTGKYLAINIETGEWELGVDHAETVLRAHAKFPTAGIYGMRIGYRAAEALGGGLRPIQKNSTSESNAE
jgi:hypothetical protein